MDLWLSKQSIFASIKRMPLVNLKLVAITADQTCGGTFYSYVLVIDS